MQHCHDRRRVLALGAAALASLAAAPGTGFAAREAAIARWLSEIVERGWVAGAAVRIETPRGPLLESRAGLADREAGLPITPDTIYRIYSMTKPVTACGVMALVEDGTLSLDQPIAGHLPEFASPRVFVRMEGDEVVTEPARTAITVRHLLTHTSGLSHSFNEGIEPTGALYRRAGLEAGQWYRQGNIATLAEFSRAVAGIPLAHHPGEGWTYGTSFDIAGALIEAARGAPFDAVLKERILAPLGMGDTGFTVPPKDRPRLAALYSAGEGGETLRVPDDEIPAWGGEDAIPTGGGGLFSTMPDYARFVRMLLNDGELDGARVLRSGTVRLMMTDQLEGRLGPEPLSSAARFGLGGEVSGLGFGLGGSVLLAPERAGGIGSAGEYGWGGAASTTFWVDRANGIGVILMTQKLPSGVHPLRDDLRRLVYNG